MADLADGCGRLADGVGDLRQNEQPICAATAMWANVDRSGLSRSHRSALRPKPVMAISTGRLCHMTPTPSGTSPSIFLLNRFTRYPSGPVTSAGGILVVDIVRSSRRGWDDHETPATTGL